MESGQVVGRIDFGPLGRTVWIAGDGDHSAVSLPERIISGPSKHFAGSILAIGAHAQDDQLGIHGQSKFRGYA